MEKLGQKLKEARKRKGYTQKQLADKVGLAEITIRQYEADKYIPKIDKIKIIAEALNMTPYELIGADFWDLQYPEISEEVKKEDAFIDYIIDLGYELDQKTIEVIMTLEDTNDNTPYGLKKFIEENGYSKGEEFVYLISKDGKTISCSENDFLKLKERIEDDIEFFFIKHLLK